MSNKECQAGQHERAPFCCIMPRKLAKDAKRAKTATKPPFATPKVSASPILRREQDSRSIRCPASVNTNPKRQRGRTATRALWRFGLVYFLRDLLSGAYQPKPLKKGVSVPQSSIITTPVKGLTGAGNLSASACVRHESRWNPNGTFPPTPCRWEHDRKLSDDVSDKGLHRPRAGGTND